MMDMPLFWLLPAVFGLVSLAWYVAVIVLLFKIWGKVKQLPGSPRTF